MFRKTVRNAALVVAGAAALLAPASMATAQPEPPPQPDQSVIRIPAGQTYCPQGYVCLFRDYEFQGGGWGFAARMQVTSLYDYSFNDMMSSWANDSGIRYCWYTDVNFQGAAHEMRPGYRVNVTPSENDTASSLRPC